MPAAKYNTTAARARDLQIEEIELSEQQQLELINPFMTAPQESPDFRPGLVERPSLKVNQQNSSSKFRGEYKEVQNFSLHTMNDEKDSILEISDEDAYSSEYKSNKLFGKLEFEKEEYEGGNRSERKMFASA